MTIQYLFPVMILAGGLATRLHPITQTMPKSLIMIDEKPFIAHQLALLQQKGIQKVIICVGYLGEQIVEYVGDGSQFNLNVTYAFDGPLLLGTAGAIKNALSLLSEQSFFVLYGDSYLPCDYAAIQTAFMQRKKNALMTVYHNRSQWDKSNVEFIDEQIVSYDKKQFTPKMQYIDYGLSILNKNVFALLPVNECFDLAELYQLLLQTQQLSGVEVKERFYEVGSFAGITDFNHYLRTSSRLSLEGNR